MTVAILLLALGGVEVERSAIYVSPYSIKSILIQEAAGLIRSVGNSDEFNYLKSRLSGGDLTRLPEIARGAAALLRSFTFDRAGRGDLWYNYAGTYRGIRFTRRTEITPGRLRLITTLQGRIRTETRRQGRAVCVVHLDGVRLVIDARERDDGTAIRVQLASRLSFTVVGRSHCGIVNRIIARRGPGIAAPQVRAEANRRTAGTVHAIIRGGRKIAGRGREVDIVSDLVEHGLRFWEWN